MSEQNKNVQLGCGTLIVIAIIVMIFSGGRSDKETRKELRDLNRKIDRLEKKIDAISAPKTETVATSTAAAPAVEP